MRSERLLLRPIEPAEAADLVEGGTAGLDWLDGSPHEGTREAAGMPPSGPEWGIFAIIRAADGLAVGGIGFHGPPADGEVEIGFDLIAGARGQGFATEALGSSPPGPSRGSTPWCAPPRCTTLPPST